MARVSDRDAGVSRQSFCGWRRVMGRTMRRSWPFG